MIRMRILSAKTLRDEIIARLSEACSEMMEVFGEEFMGLVLFGSMARGEAGGSSDVDVLVVFRSLRGVDVRDKAYSILARHVRRPLVLVDMSEGLLGWR